MERKNNFRLILVIAMFTFLTAGLTGCRLFPKEDVEDVPVLVKPPAEDMVTHTVIEGPITEEITGFAQVGSGREEKLFFTIPGRIKEVLVQSGDDVRKGQSLVVLETSDLQFGLRRARAALEQEQIRFKERFGDDDGNRPFDADEKRIAELGVESAQIEVERLEKQLADSTLIAPFSGRLTSFSAERGNGVEPYSQVAILSNMKGLEMTSDIKTEDKKRITTGTRVKVEIDGGSPLFGHVIAIEKLRASDGTERLIAHIRMDDSHFSMKMDDSFNITFCLRSFEKTMIVPNDAIREDAGGKKYLRVLEGKHRREVYVKIGIQTATQTQILEGAKPGMVVIGK